MGSRLLLVEDETAIAEFLSDNLREDDHTVRVARSIGDARLALKREPCDVALIDVGLPDGSGFDLCRSIRQGQAGDAAAGVIMLTARAEAQDRVRGFERGADDYVVKPFHYPELLARVNALAARIGGRHHSDRLVVGPLEVDLPRRTCTVNGETVALPAKEFDLLVTLARDPYKVLSKRDLLRKVWDCDGFGTSRTLDSHASRLRRRLESADPMARYVVNHWGVGYALLQES